MLCLYAAKARGLFIQLAVGGQGARHDGAFDIVAVDDGGVFAVQLVHTLGDKAAEPTRKGIDMAFLAENGFLKK